MSNSGNPHEYYLPTASDVYDAEAFEKFQATSVRSSERVDDLAPAPENPTAVRAPEHLAQQWPGRSWDCMEARVQSTTASSLLFPSDVFTEWQPQQDVDPYQLSRLVRAPPWLSGSWPPQEAHTHNLASDAHQGGQRKRSSAASGRPHGKGTKLSRDSLGRTAKANASNPPRTESFSSGSRQATRHQTASAREHIANLPRLASAASITTSLDRVIADLETTMNQLSKELPEDYIFIKLEHVLMKLFTLKEHLVCAGNPNTFEDSHALHCAIDARLAPAGRRLKHETRELEQFSALPSSGKPLEEVRQIAGLPVAKSMILAAINELFEGMDAVWSLWAQIERGRDSAEAKGGTSGGDPEPVARSEDEDLDMEIDSSDAIAPIFGVIVDVGEWLGGVPIDRSE